MRLIGEPAVVGEVIVHQFQAACWDGRPCLIWSDGQDVTCLVGDAGDTPADLLKVAPRLLPEVAA